MVEWIRSLWRRLLKRTPGWKSYITALNTFDGGPPGTGGLRDAERVTSQLIALATSRFNHPPRFGYRSHQRGIAEALLMATTFWQEEARIQKGSAATKREVLVGLLKYCHTVAIPVPLALLWPDQAALLEALAEEGIRTWQALLKAVASDHRPLYARACLALEQADPREPSPAIVIQYWLLYHLLDEYDVSIDVLPLADRRSHGQHTTRPHAITA